MIIYLDNCCFNRPFDDQSQIRINIETQAKLFVQQQIKDGKIDLVWSYMIDYENSFNPFIERKKIIQNWKIKAKSIILENENILHVAQILITLGLNTKDALHVSCAIEGGCDFFLTTDDKILKKLKDFKQISVINPLNIVAKLET